MTIDNKGDVMFAARNTARAKSCVPLEKSGNVPTSSNQSRRRARPAAASLVTIAGVHRNKLRTHPESARLQAVRREFTRMLSAAVGVKRHLDRALFLIKNDPTPAFRQADLGNQTRAAERKIQTLPDHDPAASNLKCNTISYKVLRCMKELRTSNFNL
ncbi:MULTISPECIES: hypothetical protein [unclassified Caballeronia]|uniref:hypothetical protein n=1 Tax=unclassified Caballeronia TaxID=2646786 RepID=UPI0028584C9E|nr:MULTISPECIES: hypothetical protein [unclassified Caballeronia]MDR5755217.1 hypothetical protein [Caballeronia sp. LZ024]MDR5845337.1 hypothetical protein [Caballeronia sp. LZ031]